MAHRFTLIAGRRAKIVAATADAAWKKLLVDHPIGKTVLRAGDHLGALSAEGGSKIFITERYWVFFDMTVGIDDAHFGILRLNELFRLLQASYPGFNRRKRFGRGRTPFSDTKRR